MNAGVGMDGSLRSLIHAGRSNKAVRLLADVAVELRAGAHARELVQMHCRARCLAIPAL